MPSAPARLRKKPSLDISLTGLIYTCMMIFMVLAAMHQQANLLFGVFGMMIGVMLVTWFISRLVLRKLDIRRTPPETIAVGQPATFQYSFHNRKRFWPSLSVSVGELSGFEGFTTQPQAYMLHAAGGDTATVPMEVLPIRRGIYHFDRYQLSTSFPFGFIKRAIDRRQRDTIVIFPAIAQVDQRLLARCISADQSGSRMRPRRGGSDEFYGVKEYRSGESARTIYWRRSARTGSLVSKEMTRVAPPRLLILVDTFLPDRTSASHASVERAIAMAASLIDRTLENGLSVGLLAWSDQWLVVPPARGKRFSRELLTILARLPLNTTHDRRALLEKALTAIHSGITPILFTPGGGDMSDTDPVRGNWLSIRSDSPEAQGWFTFPPGVDFGRCMPPDQAPLRADEKRSNN